MWRCAGCRHMLCRRTCALGRLNDVIKLRRIQRDPRCRPACRRLHRCPARLAASHLPRGSDPPGRELLKRRFFRVRRHVAERRIRVKAVVSTRAGRAPAADDQQELASVPGPLLLRHQSERARTRTRGARSARNPIAGRQVQLAVVAAELPVDSCDVQRATSHETRQLKRADELPKLPSFSLG